MRAEFQEYYRPTEQEFEAIWKDCFFAFDANVLLNLYFYSRPTAATYMTVLGLLKDRLWLPYQAGLEYQRNRIGVVAKVLKGYDEARKSLEQVRSLVHSKSQPPFLSEELVGKLDQLFEDANREMDESVADLSAFGSSDPIRDKLDGLFSGKVGTRFPDVQLEKIFAEGKDRYKIKVPPGYMDEKGKPGNDMFGDLVIWKELIEKAKGDKRPMVFVTDDAKEDWWYIEAGRTHGPRPELLREFLSETQQPCYLYSSESFLRNADQFLAANVDQKALEEIADAHERDRLLTFEIGYEEVETPTDSEIEAAAAKLDDLDADPDSDEYLLALQTYQQLVDRKTADTFMAKVHARLSPAAQAHRAVLVAEIQELLAKCRASSTWDSRSEYKLPSWLELVPEEMIPYTSLPKLMRIRSNLQEYLRRHIKLL